MTNIGPTFSTRTSSVFQLPWFRLTITRDTVTAITEDEAQRIVSVPQIRIGTG